MKELEDIIKAYEEAVKEGKQTALATVVDVEGSSYRRPGARMLVTEDGKLTGAISGGCLEGDALRKAQFAMAQQKPKLVRYDTTDEDDAKFGIQLGCNGIVHILIEPLKINASNSPIELFKAFVSKRQTSIFITLFSLDSTSDHPGTCMLLNKDGIINGTSPNKQIEALLIKDAESVWKKGVSIREEYENGMTGFIEIAEPPISLIIFGAGNDILPLVEMAALLGWHLTVIDGRPDHATTARFPKAKKVLVARPNSALSQIVFDERTAVLLMTHNYNYDVAMLKQLLPLQISYLGILGPKKKLDRMLSELQQQGIKANEEQLLQVYGPVGLDIGAETSEEIALSILAEIKAVMSKLKGSPLREKQQPIHS